MKTKKITVLLGVMLFFLISSSLVSAATYNTYVTDLTSGREIPHKGKTSMNRTALINVTSESVNLNISIYFNVSMPGKTPGSWSNKTCDNARSCNVTVGPFTGDTQVSYYAEAINVSGGEVERVPSSGYRYFTMLEHPVANFLVSDTLLTIFGRTEIVGIVVRNIHTSPDTINLSSDSEYVRFLDSGSQELILNMSSQEGRVFYARVLPSGLESYTVTLDASSAVDPALTNSDSLLISVARPANFPGMSDFGIVILIFLAGLIYLKLVSKGDRFQNL